MARRAVRGHGSTLDAVPAQRRTQQQRRETTERALLDAAAATVVEAGVRSLTLAEVARRAGYSRGIVTHQFGSKAALVGALAAASQAGFVPGVDAHVPGLDRLFVLLGGYLAAFDDADVRVRAFLVLWVESITSPELAPVFRERDASFRADVRADVEAGQRAGAVPPGVDAHAVAALIVAELRGLALQHLVAPDDLDLRAVTTLLVRRWRDALRA